MKQKFSIQWISSTQVRKQRKYRHHAPLHIRHKFLSSHLSKELRKKYGRRSFPIRKGDEVLIMRGKFAKKKGKISEVNLKRNRVTIENINRKKSDGTKVNVFFDASNLLIQELNLDDKKRIKSLKKDLASEKQKSLQRSEEVRSESESEKDKKVDLKTKEKEKDKEEKNVSDKSKGE